MYSTDVCARRGSGIGRGGAPLEPVEEDSAAGPETRPGDEKDPLAAGVAGVEMIEVPAIGVNGAVEFIAGRDGVLEVGLKARPVSGCAVAPDEFDG